MFAFVHDAERNSVPDGQTELAEVISQRKQELIGLPIQFVVARRKWAERVDGSACVTQIRIGFGFGGLTRCCGTCALPEGR